MAISTSYANVYDLTGERAEREPGAARCRLQARRAPRLDRAHLRTSDRAVQLDAAAAGTLAIIPDAVARKSGRDMDAFSERESDAGIGALEFAALMRRLDRSDPSYRE